MLVDIKRIKKENKVVSVLVCFTNIYCNECTIECKSPEQLQFTLQIFKSLFESLYVREL